MLVITVESHSAPARQGKSYRPTFLHHVSTLNRCQTRKPASHFWSFHADALKSFCVSPLAREREVCPHVRVLFWCNGSFKVHRYMSDRSLMPCLSLIAACPPLVRLFPRVLDHGESPPWFTATPCIFVAGHGFSTAPSLSGSFG